MESLKINKIRNDLRQISVASGASESVISENAGFNRNVLNKFLTGKQDLRLKTLIKILSSLGYEIKLERKELK